ncbi:MAG TPA: hypothetical protein DCS07_14850 [Bdellovibrionales bacterium]|nr:MAG: hypothetical protein A2Z97_11085 [Bdellovibrionales bacterium GWB1_52_6]OFZ02552.1 MAG: hypothetical protein A2X97_07795 [Bdellovibrionales bacterium GWA1_52_35]OFZ39557.1 MAG: hypothetical protein A2070_02020 [Bdellovibrionales bacterium GWC1_52_8]HAR43889.1 hypothetical protein [Bdellovibrionales bacterium]HCM41402.1 hypothetical protein [Bdellovibrionales bacterium]
MAFRKIGKSALITTALCAALCLVASSTRPFAAFAKEPEIQFTAEVDRNQVSADESVSLRLKVRAEGSANVSNPQFTAPDFDEINQYSSVFVESYYENGRFGMRKNHSVTKVLRPRKVGDLKISGIQIKVEDKAYSAPDITIQVGGAGAGTPAPKGYGGSGVGLRGAAKAVNHRNVILRAEIDKDRAYKGEQIVVSYYIYTRVQLFNIAVEKWPTLNGFLREDLEVPVMGTSGRMDADQVVMDGTAYKRSLLVRYAAYPLQNGKLKIDPIALKYNYYPAQRGMDDEDDDPFTQFFQQMAPRPGSDRSDTLTIEVIPVPEEGKPSSFTGGVGDFTLTAAVDKTEVKANEALTLIAKVEGRGNLASIGEPKAKWPDQLELYDSKGRAKTSKSGVGDKIFEFLLLPRVPGPLTLPRLELSFFDPNKKIYITRSTEPITINVLPGSQGAPAPQPKKGAPSLTASGDPQTEQKQEVRYLKPPGVDTPVTAWPIWRMFYWAAIVALGVFLLLVARDLLEKGRATAQGRFNAKAKAHARSWEKLSELASTATRHSDQLPWNEVVSGYELLESLIFDALERLHPGGARALSRQELREILVQENQIPEILWERIEKTLDFADLVRFASSAGAISQEAARLEFSKWIDEAKSIVLLLERKQSPNSRS